jgi:hypothetical protein
LSRSYDPNPEKNDDSLAFWKKYKASKYQAHAYSSPIDSPALHNPARGAIFELNFVPDPFDFLGTEEVDNAAEEAMDRQVLRHLKYHPRLEEVFSKFFHILI